EEVQFQAPPVVTEAIAKAKHISEPLSGTGESETLQRVTVNIGTIEGGTSPNLVPTHAIARADIRLPGGITTDAPAVNMRVGGSDSRWYRPAGVPTVVLGLTPFNMGGADEYVLVDELIAVAKIHTLTAFDFLTSEH